MPLTYIQPGVTLVTSGAQAVFNPPQAAGKVCLMLGRAPQGPDYPVLCTFSDAVTMFGDPASTASAGYDLPLAIRLAAVQRQPTRNTPVQFLVCRVGVQRAQVNVLDGSSNVGFVLQGIGPYAGSKGSNLKFQTTQAGTNTNAVQTITVNGAPTSASITFSFQGVTTSAPLAWTSGTTAGAVQTNLQTIPALTGNCTVTGSAGGPYTVTFNVGLANTAVPLIATVSPTTFVGGTGPNVAIAQTTAGSAVFVNTFTIFDATTGTNVQKQQFTNARDNLTTVQNIANAINGGNPLNNPASIVQAVQVNAAAGIPAVAGPTALVGGYDGLGAGASDGTIATLLQQSLWTHADYVWAGFDAATIAATLVAHSAAATAPGVNELRKFFLGPKAGTTFASLSTTYLSGASLSSDRFVVIGHDSIFVTNPINNYNVAVDGFFAAAIAMGIKASGPTQETASKFPLAGIMGQVIPSDKTSLLQSADLNTLAGNGLTVFEASSAQTGRFQIRDHITTAPYGLNGGVNVFSQHSARDIDDAFSKAMVDGCTPHIGRPYPSRQHLQSAVLTTTQTKAAQLGDTINGSNITVDIDPTTFAPLVRGTYGMPYPVLTINIPTNFTF